MKNLFCFSPTVIQSETDFCAAVAVTVAVPFFRACALPFDETETIEASDDFHITPLAIGNVQLRVYMPSKWTLELAVIVCVSPTVIVSFPLKAMLVTAFFSISTCCT